MENHTSFDLTAAIRQWRQNLAQASEFQRADLDELESHLRESIASLQTSGLSVEEAYLIATRRIGPARSLAVEFQKIRQRDIVRDCVLWACIGLLIWGLFAALNPGVGMFKETTHALIIIGVVMTLGVSGQSLLSWLRQRAREGYDVKKIGKAIAMVLLLSVIGVLAINLLVPGKTVRYAPMAQNRR